ncbi:MAG: hypothetical protein HFF84_04260 [Oscillibacter sp.]|nr:hypothetical protein [Oscillibacter sp.]
MGLGETVTKKKIALEAAILRMADKIDRISQRKSDAREDYDESLRRIKTCFKKNKKKFHVLIKISKRLASKS